MNNNTYNTLYFINLKTVYLLNMYDELAMSVILILIAMSVISKEQIH